MLIYFDRYIINVPFLFTEVPSNVPVATVGQVPALVDIIKTQFPGMCPDVTVSSREDAGVDTLCSSATPAIDIELSEPFGGKQNCLDIIPSEDKKSEDLEDACSNLLERIRSEDYMFNNGNTSSAFHSAVRDLTTALSELSLCSERESYSHEDNTDHTDDSTVSNSVSDEETLSSTTTSSGGDEISYTERKVCTLDTSPQYDLHTRTKYCSHTHLSIIPRKEALESTNEDLSLDENFIPNINFDQRSSDDQNPFVCQPSCYDDKCTLLESDSSQLVLENDPFQATLPFQETMSTVTTIRNIDLNEKEPVCPNTTGNANRSDDSEGLTTAVPCCSRQGAHAFTLKLNETTLLPNTDGTKDYLEATDSRNLLLEDAAAEVKKSPLTLELSQDDCLVVSEAELHSTQTSSASATSSSTDTKVCITHTVEGGVGGSKWKQGLGQFQQTLSYNALEPLQECCQTCEDSVYGNQSENNISVKTESVESIKFASNLAMIESQASLLKENTIDNVATHLVSEALAFMDIPDDNAHVHQQETLLGRVPKERFERKDSCNVSDIESIYKMLSSNEIPRPNPANDVSSQSSNYERREELENRSSNMLECVRSCSRYNTSDEMFQGATKKKKDIDNLKKSIEEKALATQVYTPKISSLDVSSISFHSKALSDACLKLFSKANPHLREFSTSWSQLDDDTLVYVLKNEPELRELCLVRTLGINRPLHGFRHYLVVAAKITENVWREILQLSTLITPQ